MISQALNLGNFNVQTNFPLRLIYIGTELKSAIIKQFPDHFSIDQRNSLQELTGYLDSESAAIPPDVLVLERDQEGTCFSLIENLKQNPLWKELIIVMIGSDENKIWKTRALQLKVHDYYTIPFPVEHLIERIGFLVKFKNFVNGAF